jgi:hypothetical protein
LVEQQSGSIVAVCRRIAGITIVRLRLAGRGGAAGMVMTGMERSDIGATLTAGNVDSGMAPRQMTAGLV